MRAFDAHTHVFAPEQAIERDAIATGDPVFAEMYGDPKAAMATAPDLSATIEADGLAGAVAAGFAFRSEREIERQAGHILEAAAGHRGIVPVVPVNPALPGWEARAVRALDGGARGFGELRPGSQGWDPLDRPGRRLAGLAGDAGVPLLWHVSEPVGHAYPGKRGGISPGDFIELACECPQTTMIGAHLGGGAAFYLQMPEVKSMLRSVYFDTAAAFLLYDEDCVIRLVDLAGADRVLYASDYPLLSPRRQLERVQARLPEGVREAVCGGNARSLFGQTTE